jgi:hypothetical protein
VRRLDWTPKHQRTPRRQGAPGDVPTVRRDDATLETVVADADRVIWVGETLPQIQQVELHAGRDLELPDRMHVYSTILRRTHKIPVHTTVVRLRPAART